MTAKTTTLAAVVLLTLACIYVWESCTAITEQNRPAAEAIVVAVEAYKLKEGRYPEGLHVLVPRYLGTIPAAGRHFSIVYAVEPGGTQCWVAYQVHRDYFEEYDCRKRVWQSVEWNESNAPRQPGAQWLKSEIAREGEKRAVK